MDLIPFGGCEPSHYEMCLVTTMNQEIIRIGEERVKVCVWPPLVEPRSIR